MPKTKFLPNVENGGVLEQSDMPRQLAEQETILMAAENLLAVRPVPYHLESIRAYLMRVAESNGHLQIEKIFYSESLGRIDLSPLGPALFFVRSSFPRTLLDELEWPSNRRTWAWNLKRSRFCSLCLRAGNHWSLAWELMLITACPVHGCALIDHCQNCKASITWSRPSITICKHCQQPFDKAEPEMAAPGERGVTSILFQALNSTALPAPFENLTLDDLSRLLTVLGNYGAGDDDRKPINPARMSKVAIAKNIVETVAPLVENWHDGFSQMLSRIAARHGNAGTLNALFKPLFGAIYRKLNDDRFHFVREEFVRYVSRNWRRPITRRHRRLPGVSATHTWVPISALRRNGVSEAVAKRLSLDHPENTERIQCASRTKTAMLKDATLQTFSNYKNACSLESAAERLALPRRRVREMLKAGLLKELSRTSTRQPRYIEAASVDKWNACVQQHMGKAAYSEYVTLKSQLRSRIATEHEWIGFLRRVDAGKATLRWSRNDPRLGASKVKVEEVVASRTDAFVIKASLTKQGILSIPELANVTGFKQEVCYHLVKRRLLAAKVISISGRPTQFVTPAALETFRHKFVSLAEIANERRVAPRALLSKLRMNKIYPITGPDIDGCRQYFLRRLDTLKI